MKPFYINAHMTAYLSTSHQRIFRRFNTAIQRDMYSKAPDELNGSMRPIDIRREEPMQPSV